MSRGKAQHGPLAGSCCGIPSREFSSRHLASQLTSGFSKIAVCVKSAYMPRNAELDRLCVVLVATHNPLNMGAVARAMSNFGFSRLRVVNPYDAAFREARSAAGAWSLLANAKEYPDVAEAVADCELVVGTTAVGHREVLHPLRRLEYGSRLIRKQLRSGGVALLFGSEKFGLSNRDLSHCHWLLRVPTGNQNISMNLGQAAAVCLYELIRDSKIAGPRGKTETAKSSEVERMVLLLLDTLQESGYLDRNARTPGAEARIRRLVRRLRIATGDAEVWTGMLRQILWKVRSSEKSSGE